MNRDEEQSTRHKESRGGACLRVLPPPAELLAGSDTPL
jgi:hypothetical protein